MCECEKDEFGESQEKAIDRLDANIEKYLERYEEKMENNEEVLARAEYAGVQTITSSTSVTVAQTPHPVQFLDKFTAYTELKPKFLQKESTLLEVKSWTRQAKLYITAGYKTDPPIQGIVRDIAPWLQQI